MPKWASDDLEVNKAAIKRKEEQTKQAMRQASLSVRDIAPLPIENINWERRKKYKFDLKGFNKEYLSSIFSREYSESHIAANDRLEKTSLSTGMFALAMPRGEGKTATAIGSCIWDQAYGHRRYIYLIGSDQDQADDRLLTIKDEWFLNEKLAQDFPELAYPVFRIEGRNELTKGQRFNNKQTKISWAVSEIRFACLVLSLEEISPYIENGLEEELISLDDNGELWSFRNNGNIMKVKGIEGNIRGALIRHPLTGELLRPDKFILDDVQTDKVAENPNSVRKMIRHIDGAIKGLADPTVGIAGVNLCTVRADNDVSETYLDKTKKPEWNPQRCSIVRHWPEGITDLEITDATVSSRGWQVYADLRNEGLKDGEGITAATEYYRLNRDIMDDGFIVDNPNRFSIPEGEISAQQHAMNLRLYNLIAFMSEYMNKPVREMSSGTIIVNVNSVYNCSTNIPRFSVPKDCTEICAHIDVGEDILWYTIGASSRKFNIHIPDYGTWPESNLYITKLKARQNKFISRAYLKYNPENGSGRGSSAKAPLEPRIYWAIQQLIAKIKNTVLLSGTGEEMRVSKIGIDAGYGKLTKTIYRLIYDLQDPSIFPTFGRFVGATSQQFSDYSSNNGQFIGEHLIVKPPSERDLSVKGTVYPIGHLLVDANYWKSFLWNRIATPQGSRTGVITLFDGNHEMFADHVAKSEYPTSVSARNLTIDEWKLIVGNDNDLLDTTYNVCAILSLMGCSMSDHMKEENKRAMEVMALMDAATKSGIEVNMEEITNKIAEVQRQQDPPVTRKIGKKTFRVREWRQSK